MRIARGIGIHRDSSARDLSTFDREMRRRLWYAIMSLDVQTATDRSSEMATPEDRFDLPLPKNVNDSDIHPGYNGPLRDREEFTDMSAALLAAEASPFIACLDLGVMLPQTTERLTTWEGRKRYIMDFHEHIQRKYLRHCDPRFPLQWITLAIGKAVTAEGKLCRCSQE